MAGAGPRRAAGRADAGPGRPREVVVRQTSHSRGRWGPQQAAAAAPHSAAGACRGPPPGTTLPRHGRSPVRILLLTPVFPPARGGIEVTGGQPRRAPARRASSSSRWRPGRGTVTGEARRHRPGCRVLRLPNEPRGGRRSILLLNAAALAAGLPFRPDVVLSLHVKAAPAGAGAQRAVPGAPRPVGPRQGDARGPGAGALRRRSAPPPSSRSAPTAPSSPSRPAPNPARVTTIPPGVDPPVGAAGRPRPAPDARHRLPPGGPLQGPRRRPARAAGRPRRGPGRPLGRHRGRRPAARARAARPRGRPRRRGRVPRRRGRRHARRVARPRVGLRAALAPARGRPGRRGLRDRLRRGRAPTGCPSSAAASRASSTPCSTGPPACSSIPPTPPPSRMP